MCQIHMQRAFDWKLEASKEPPDTEESRDTSTTFTENMKLPIHRWFRYSAGFSAEWVQTVIQQHASSVDQANAVLLDPFAGSGTTLLAAQSSGLTSRGLEAHPFVARIARTKLLWHHDARTFRSRARAVLRSAEARLGTTESYPILIGKCFPEPILRRLDALKTAWDELADGNPDSELVWLAITSILRSCSPVGTSQTELIQPKKQKLRVQDPFEAYQERVELMLADMAHRRRTTDPREATVLQGDARSCSAIPDDSIDLVITSPPYANNFDYADATRLEMTFWGEIQGWSDLQEKVRTNLLRACSQHMSSADTIEDLLSDFDAPIRPQLSRACQNLSAERLNHGGKKNYHLMVAAYFADMLNVWKALRRVCKPGSALCIVIGDSAPYGVYVPVHEWLAVMALSVGFNETRFEKTRDRNVKWKNRKHRVPLCEGRLWIAG